MTQQITHLKSYMEYMNMFFDNTFSIQNGEIAKFSDEALLSALQNSPEYRLVTLVKDAKRGAKVVDLNPQTISDIKKARELNAVIMSGQTYSTAYGAINTFGMRHDKLNMLHKINYLYKAGYILSPGTMLRNIVDSVMKNYVAASDDPTGMTQAFLTAWQIYWKYRKTAKQLIDYCYDTATGTSSITEELSEQFFKANVSPLTKELYEFAHGFYTDGPSGGEIKELAKYFMHDKKLSPYGITTQILNFLMQPNEVVEQVCRFAEYIWALGQDMSSTKAYALIAKTHFDYAIKTDTQRLLELVFPF
jgi:hypothetical protein